ncbi:Dynein heavy chain 14, axonemal [Frankliniella fusca]|uniref:Dynein heavy chain 14, axonemal n=1 Tax=Frankliniella fusca TaxID=407009 RepID=A0AAE1HMG6_9NEOP|nr:Dynein heavy chain 14, axonemal [Frankliniella fusca]
MRSKRKRTLLSGVQNDSAGHGQQADSGYRSVVSSLSLLMGQPWSRRAAGSAPAATKASPAPPSALAAPAAPGAQPPPAPPPVIRAEDADAPAVTVRPATPTITVCPGSRRGSTSSRRGSSCLEAGLAGEGTSRRRSSCGLEPILPEDGGPPSRRGSSASLLRIAEEVPGPGPDTLTVLENSLLPSPSPSPTRRKKSLTWKGDDDLCQAPESEPTPSKSIQSDSAAEDSATAETKLLPSQDTEFKTDDVTLHSILNHIAYVNRGPRANSDERVQTSNRRRQLREVIHLTSATAILGLVLSVASVFQLFGPYGQLVGSCESGRGPAWLWFTFQTLCRLMELAMGCAMANVTKQPVSGPQAAYLHHSHYAGGLRLKRESLYL